MKSILAGVIVGLFVSPLSAQMFGLGEDTPVEVVAVVTSETFGLHEAVAMNITKADTFRDFVAPVYETVNVTTGYRTVCFGDHCEQVPIVSTVRRLVTATPVVSVTVAKTVAATPTGTANGFPPPGFHDHTDSAGNTWRHGHEMNGSTEAHVSPATGEIVLDRSADGGGEFMRFGRPRLQIMQRVRSRFSLRR